MCAAGIIIRKGNVELPLNLMTLMTHTFLACLKKMDRMPRITDTVKEYIKGKAMCRLLLSCSDRKKGLYLKMHLTLYLQSLIQKLWDALEHGGKEPIACCPAEGMREKDLDSELLWRLLVSSNSCDCGLHRQRYKHRTRQIKPPWNSTLYSRNCKHMFFKLCSLKYSSPLWCICISKFSASNNLRDC
ncbi:hypothetical protein K7X08_034130 [Anisodus acutangulus]|uniref:Uncharacterized protein n=1 Tax=Anisodus acutangulus TaxID=402998 RepID=A0A9Q1LC41_9SOLA|nr:hypothetical protein K7X08_034130 [Anisodus acutangulus]